MGETSLKSVKSIARFWRLLERSIFLRQVRQRLHRVGVAIDDKPVVVGKFEERSHRCHRDWALPVKDCLDILWIRLYASVNLDALTQILGYFGFDFTLVEVESEMVL